MKMRELEKYFLENEGLRIHKWIHFFDIYETHFDRFRGTDVHVLEIGVDSGGSLQMWRHYFGPDAKIFGMDINPNCIDLEQQLGDKKIRIFIGDQSDKEFLLDVFNRIKRIDIIIDDGGHTMEQQINTFEVLFPLMNEGGIYVCEDISTSYLGEYGGGYKFHKTFVEYSKNLIDYVHAWHSREQKKLSINHFTKSVFGLHYYNNILVIEKRTMHAPKLQKTGKRTIGLQSIPPTGPLPIWFRVGQRLSRIIHCLRQNF